MVVYIVIAADILAGSKHLPGVLCDVFGDADWCQNRTWVAIGVTVLVLIPIVSTRYGIAIMNKFLPFFYQTPLSSTLFSFIIKDDF